MNALDVIGLALVYAIIAVSLGTALALRRRGSRVDPRKVVHIGVGCFVFVWWMFSANWIMLVAFTIPFAAILFVAMLRDNAVSRSEIGDLANNTGNRTGLFLYAVSITVLVAFFWDHWTAATVGAVAMTWGDGMGSVVGRRFGKHRTMNGKSAEGSLAVFASTAVMTAVIVLLYSFIASAGTFPWGAPDPVVPVWAISIVSGLIASILEMLCPGEYDNLLMPLVVALAMVPLGL